MYDYEYLWKEVDGELKLSYSYYPLWHRRLLCIDGIYGVGYKRLQIWSYVK